MSKANRNEVIATAQETTAAQLSSPGIAELLATLPAGDPDMVSRPDSPTWEWPGLEELSARVENLEAA
jgi:hypothetical protein